MTGGAWIGTSGWNYKHWRGEIYPEGLPQRRWLEYTAERFDTVEINTSFYRIPKRETVEAWVAGTPPHFRFALKLWRGITHYLKLRNAGDLTERFLHSAEALPANRRAPLLLQLPPNQASDIDKLTDYIEEFHSLATGHWKIAVEFRHASWLSADVSQALAKLDVAVCLHDMHGRAENDEPNDASFIYVRRHGPAGGKYSGNYTEAMLKGDAARIRSWVAEGRHVFVYFNNDIGGHAWRNASRLAELIRSAKG